MSRVRRFSSRDISHQANAAAAVTSRISSVASALIFGLSPRRTDENTFIGKVVDEGPLAKLATTRSSIDSVKASSQPETSAGMMIGNVIWKNTCTRLAPRSIAASSMDLSSSPRREETTTVTKATQKVTCAIQIVVMPRDTPMATNSSRMDNPVITSGMTSGAVIRAPNSSLPRNWRKRVITSEAIVASTTDAQAVKKAMRMLTQAASMMPLSRNSSPYHFTEKPAHTVTSFDSLKEYTTRLRIGAYRNTKPNTSMPLSNGDWPGRSLMSAGAPVPSA